MDPDQNDNLNVVSSERAPKRRRLNIAGQAASPPASSLPRHTTHATATRSVDGWPVSDEFVRVLDHTVGSSTNIQDPSVSLSYALDTEPTSANRNRRPSPPLGDPSTAYGTSIDPLLDAQSLPQPSILAAGPSSEFSLPGDRNLPFGLLYNSQPAATTHAASGQSPVEHASMPAPVALDHLEAIDLTTVNDGPALRRREELDDESRRLRREASMKIEARRKANAQMLKSTLEEQQAGSVKADPSAGKQGLEGMQCVICMDNFTDMTATHCGHLFCHTCINEHLITAETARSYPTTKVWLRASGPCC